MHVSVYLDFVTGRCCSRHRPMTTTPEIVFAIALEDRSRSANSGDKCFNVNTILANAVLVACIATCLSLRLILV